ncbi:MAG: hypothetical protein HFF57_07810, partial [Lawsonibacter sp.]|nr:hypothetical protein [Lawsonibacter sp.]
SATTSVIYLVAEDTVEQDAMAALREKAAGQNAMMAAIRARAKKYRDLPLRGGNRMSIESQALGIMEGGGYGQ